eukprot:12932415-Prorocentrum_lima.AAC.1
MFGADSKAHGEDLQIITQHFNSKVGKAEALHVDEDLEQAYWHGEHEVDETPWDAPAYDKSYAGEEEERGGSTGVGRGL